MTNFVAFCVAAAICAVILFDLIVFGGDNIVFTLRKFDGLIEWLAFWR